MIIAGMREAENLHIHGVERPPAETSPKSALLTRLELPVPSCQTVIYACHVFLPYIPARPAPFVDLDLSCTAHAEEYLREENFSIIAPSHHLCRSQINCVEGKAAALHIPLPIPTDDQASDKMFWLGSRNRIYPGDRRLLQQNLPFADKAVRGLRHVLELIADAGSTNEAGRFSPVELHRHGA